MTDHKPLIYILKQQNLCVALQQWLDVLLDYDLTIIYRPGILHVVPDALSRMYMASIRTTMMYGVLIRIYASSMIIIKSRLHRTSCARQSIDEARAPKPVRKRHKAIQPSTAVQGSGEGDNGNDDSSTANSTLFSSIMAISHLCENDCESSVTEVITEDDQFEFDMAKSSLPLYSVEDATLPVQLSAVMHADAPRPLTQLEQAEDDAARQQIADAGFQLVRSNKREILQMKRSYLSRRRSEIRRYPPLHNGNS